MITEQTASAIVRIYGEIATAEAMLADPSKLVLSDNYARRHLPAPQQLAAPLIEAFIAEKRRTLAELMQSAQVELKTEGGVA